MGRKKDKHKNRKYYNRKIKGETDNDKKVEKENKEKILPKKLQKTKNMTKKVNIQKIRKRNTQDD